ncbi:glycosyltransferase family 39 protein, partial [Nitrospinota bacterium]
MPIRKNVVFLLMVLGGLLFAWFINNDRLMGAANTNGQYLVQAIDISQGRLAIRYERGPIFPLLLAGAFYIGKDVLVSAFWVTQFIFFVSILLTVYLTNMLYGKRVALISAIFLYSSKLIFELNWMFGLRFLVVSFLLASCILFVTACKSSRKWVFHLSGVALGLAILTKETGFFYFYFPFLFLLIPNFRKKKILYGIGQFYIGLFLVALLWGGVLLYADQTLLKFFGAMSPSR